MSQQLGPLGGATTDYDWIDQLPLPSSSSSTSTSIVDKAATTSVPIHALQASSSLPSPSPPPPSSSTSTRSSIILPVPSSTPTKTTFTNSLIPRTNQYQSVASVRSASLPSLAAIPSANLILVSSRQRGNPLLEHIVLTPWQFSDGPLLADYVFGTTTGALYLSLRYHMLHPAYLNTRIVAVGNHYACRIVLCMIDVEDSDIPLQAITKTCFVNGWTLLCSWSLEECGRYCETIKTYEKRSAADMLPKIDDTDDKSRVSECLGLIKSINRTDVSTLMTEYRTFADLVKARKEHLLQLGGMGDKKVQRLFKVMNSPFVSSSAPTYAKIN